LFVTRCLFAAWLLIACMAGSVWAKPPATQPIKPVFLDVGHSHKAPGVTAASGVSEFFYNQALAKHVSALLMQRSIPHSIVGLAGDADVLTDRTAAAVSAGLFISLHHDSVQAHYLKRVHDFSGYSLFVSRKNRFSKQSLACAQRLGDQFLAAGFSPTPHHHEPIKGENRPWADERRGVYWFDDLIVLKTAKQPAVLVEAGVIVNPVEDQYLRSDAGRATVAAVLAAGIADCFGS
jgi:N-acetylmuramoyl-L-alanine amidase